MRFTNKTMFPSLLLKQYLNPTGLLILHFTTKVMIDNVCWKIPNVCACRLCKIYDYQAVECLWLDKGSLVKRRRNRIILCYKQFD